MGINIQRADTEDFKVTLIEPSHQEEPTIYDLKYLVYRLDLQKELNLNDMETKLLSFILSFDNVSDKFYFGNETLGKLFGKHTNTISSAISSLEKKGLIECTMQIMSGGGKIRFIRLTENWESDSQKTVSKTHRKLGENNNKINNNKINSITTSKDVGKTRPKEKAIHSLKRKAQTYGNGDINVCTQYLRDRLGSSLDGSVKENRLYCYNLLRKMKKDYPDVEPVVQVKVLIDLAMQDKFHRKNATGFKYLYYNAQRIAQSFKGDYGIGEDNSDIQVI